MTCQRSRSTELPKRVKVVCTILTNDLEGARQTMFSSSRNCGCRPPADELRLDPPPLPPLPLNILLSHFINRDFFSVFGGAESPVNHYYQPQKLVNIKNKKSNRIKQTRIKLEALRFIQAFYRTHGLLKVRKKETEEGELTINARLGKVVYLSSISHENGSVCICIMSIFVYV